MRKYGKVFYNCNRECNGYSYDLIFGITILFEWGSADSSAPPNMRVVAPFRSVAARTALTIRSPDDPGRVVPPMPTMYGAIIART